MHKREYKEVINVHFQAHVLNSRAVINPDLGLKSAKMHRFSLSDYISITVFIILQQGGEFTLFTAQ